MKAGKYVHSSQVGILRICDVPHQMWCGKFE